MDKNLNTRVKISAGALCVEFEGSEAFLRSQLPKFVQAARELQRSDLKLLLGNLQVELQEAREVKVDIDEQVATIKASLDSLNEMTTLEGMRLQMMMERRSKSLEMLSNVLKKISETSSGIVQNLK